MRKKIQLAILIFLVCAIFYSCKKDYIVVDCPVDNCPEMYERRSQEYINPYMGTLETSFPGTPQTIFPDSYGYIKPCMNPINPFEFCYFKIDNSGPAGGFRELYKFNFCSGRSTLITDKAYANDVDWSVKDWILFTGEGRDLWKIKSNGESITRLTNKGGALQYDPKWNTTGTMYKWSALQVADETGTVLYTLSPTIGFIIDWYDEQNVLRVISGAKEVTKLNVATSQSEFFAPMPEGFYLDYNKDNNEFLGSLDSMNRFKNILYNVSMGTTTYFSDNYIQRSFQTVMHGQINGRILAQQNLSDTMTGTPSKINQRNHIVILNKDGSNIRQVLLP